MQALFFERPLLLSPLLALLVLILTVIWSRSRTRATRRALLGALGAAPLLMLVQALVVTDRERITAVCRALADAVERGDVNAFARHVAADFRTTDSGDGLAISRDELLAAFDRGLSRYHPEGVRLDQFEIHVTGAHATAEFTATAAITSADQFISRVVSRWRLIFRRGDAGWQVIDIQPHETPFWPFRRLRDLL